MNCIRLLEVPLLSKGLFIVILLLCLPMILIGCSQDASTASTTKEKLVETVLGPISKDDLGLTLMHEHIIWDWFGAESERKEKYTEDEVLDIMLPYLISLKESGFQTLVDGTPKGAGRDIEILKLCAEKSGLNILTCTGVWHPISSSTIPQEIKNKSPDQIAQLWIREYNEGIEGSGIKPAFIKITLPDRGDISQEQKNMFRAAIITSMETGLPIECHNLHLEKLKSVLPIMEEEGISFDKFIWLHSDYIIDVEGIIDMAKKGMYIELDSLGRIQDFNLHTKLLKRLIHEDLIDRVLMSQDGGSFYVDETNDGTSIVPYDRIAKEFLPKWREAGISQDVINKIFIENPSRVLGM